jgi:FKBP-type peptidyl-prolyl cis-trans isomerase 2
MRTVQPDDSVTLSYIGKLDNGEVFKTIAADDQLTVALGHSEIPPTLENTLVGMKVGETRKVRLSPEEGFGPRHKDLLQTIDNKEFLQKIQPKPGMILSLAVNKDGEEYKVPATVIEVKNNETVVDYNHPLAGHHLNYEVTILAIQEKS